MVEYVAKISGADSPGASTDLAEVLQDYRGVTLNAGVAEVRDSEPSEVDGFATWLGELRSALLATDEVTYHECRHDEGIGDCSAAVVIK